MCTKRCAEKTKTKKVKGLKKQKSKLVNGNGHEGVAHWRSLPSCGEHGVNRQLATTKKYPGSGACSRQRHVEASRQLIRPRGPPLRDTAITVGCPPAYRCIAEWKKNTHSHNAASIATACGTWDHDADALRSQPAPIIWQGWTGGGELSASQPQDWDQKGQPQTTTWWK